MGTAEGVVSPVDKTGSVGGFSSAESEGEGVTAAGAAGVVEVVGIGTLSIVMVTGAVNEKASSTARRRPHSAGRRLCI